MAEDLIRNARFYQKVIALQSMSAIFFAVHIANGSSATDDVANILLSAVSCALVILWSLEQVYYLMLVKTFLAIESVSKIPRIIQRKNVENCKAFVKLILRAFHIFKDVREPLLWQVLLMSICWYKAPFAEAKDIFLRDFFFWKLSKHIPTIFMKSILLAFSSVEFVCFKTLRLWNELSITFEGREDYQPSLKRLDKWLTCTLDVAALSYSVHCHIVLVQMIIEFTYTSGVAPLLIILVDVAVLAIILYNDVYCLVLWRTLHCIRRDIFAAWTTKLEQADIEADNNN